MTLPLIVSDEAEADLREATIWYGMQRSGLDDEFLACVESAFERIQHAPWGRAEVILGVRCRLTDRFPYGVYYALEADFIKILAVYHTSRDPRGWKARS